MTGNAARTPGNALVHLVSYSYPPDNAPGAHRPYQLALQLHEAGIPFRLFTRHGVSEVPWAFEAPRAQVRAHSTPKLVQRLFYWLSSRVAWLIEVDKGLPWGLRTAPKVCWALLASRLRTRNRPVLWTTSPLVSNLYVGAAACLFSGGELHVDLRDAIRGIGPSPAPALTRWALRRAATVSVVTQSLGEMCRRRLPWLDPVVIYNGISEEAVAAAKSESPDRGGWLRVSYAGALYGGERPFEETLKVLATTAELLGEPWVGLTVEIACREEIGAWPAGLESARFRLNALGDLSKPAALALAATSHANLLLMGYADEHRCGIPLKTFDLLGVGRPILYAGPAISDARSVLDEWLGGAHCVFDPRVFGQREAVLLAAWLTEAGGKPSRPRTEPSASRQGKRIATLVLGRDRERVGQA